ncbi:Phosphatidylinositol transfer protein 2 [Tritrichomonas foetus]|uniref:Phosphatidylinositol transfer protein 2 n=1 Tax=Tritrichomonas foetus TaxID=1144522 RepID=A0A1J4K2B4_9EUKA|nr:Phosphatidylinositol transfer protein 2 [Tritrichomonas foetus]|eukprot:OHT03878.1 Phosphatidylinositol transfer protein 2 [Tritrichomonas foetus]
MTNFSHIISQIFFNMKIYEFRIVCPTSVEQYKIGNIYMTAKKTEEESTVVKGEGIETITNETFSSNNENGIYTYKIMHFKSRIPSFMRWSIPDKYCHCHEHSWNTYPHFFTEYSVPGMGKDLVMTIESRHVSYINGEPINENLLNLNEKELKKRKIVCLDLLDSKHKWGEGKKRDLSKWICPKLGVHTPLQAENPNILNESEPPSWTKKFNGEMMVAVKVVKLRFHWRGLQKIVENYAMKTVYHNLFLDAHKAMMNWGDEWGSMSFQDVRNYESRLTQQINNLEFNKDEK